MMSKLTCILNSYLMLSITRQAPLKPRPDPEDPFATTLAYRSFFWPLRRVLALRYLSYKETLLAEYHISGSLPIRQAVFAEQMKSLLGPPARRVPWLLRPFVLASMLAVLAVVFVWGVSTHRHRQRQQDQLVAGLLSYSNLIHEQTSARQYERILTFLRLGALLGNDEETYEKAELGLLAQQAQRGVTAVMSQAQRDHLIGLFAGNGVVQEKLGVALDLVRNEEANAEAVVQGFAEANRSLRQSRIPYYLSPTILGGPCAGFLSLELRGAIHPEMAPLIWPGEKTMCQTTLVMPYRIKNRTEYLFENQSYPVYELQRLGRYTMVESALGLTYHHGEGSQVHTDRIRRYVIENILPALTPNGRTVMFPWLHSNWQVTDDVASAVEVSLRNIYSERQRDLLRRYAEKLVRFENIVERARLHQTLLALGHRTGPSKNSDVLSLGLDVLINYQDEVDSLPPQQKLSASKKDHLAVEADELRKTIPPAVEILVEKFVQAVAYHEVQHQLHDRGAQPKHWVKDPRWVALRDLSQQDNGVGEEVAAYLVELRYGENVRHIVLTQLAAFALSTMPGAEREYEAGQIILAALLDEHGNRFNGPRRFSGPLALLAGFQKLRDLSDAELGNLSRRAYFQLMGYELPTLTPSGGHQATAG